jgi:hypothetical protein
VRTTHLSAAIAIGLLLSTAGWAAAGTPPPARERDVLLDVPYLSQTQQLCGGAAVAMVLRYWGDADVHAQDFASLVDRSEGGIRTSTLVRAVTGRGWEAAARAGDPAFGADAIRHEITRGRPVIALIQDRPRILHYVVIVGTTMDTVVLHDPARAPYRVIGREEFEERWAAAGRWLLLVLPSRESPPSAPPTTARAESASAIAEPGACDKLVAANVALARAGRRAEAEAGLLAATALCPSGASAWSELAGLRFVQKRYGDSAELAGAALKIEPGDAETWRLLATARYLGGDELGALEAWNAVGLPLVDTVAIEGAVRTHHPVIAEMTGLEPRDLLTPGAFETAARRLAELPVAKDTALRYRPLPGGRAAVEAVVTERGVRPAGMAGWGTIGVNALFRRDVTLKIAGPAGHGEVWEARYRWAENRPRARLAYSLPAPGRLPGILTLDGMWDRQSYAPVTAGDAIVREERRHAGIALSDWAASWLQWTAGAAMDRFDDGSYAAAQGEIGTRWLNDRVAGLMAFSHWTPVSQGRRFSTAELSVAWRTSTAPTVPALLGRAGLTAVGAGTPLAFWPVAGSGDSRGAMLRARRLTERGIVSSDVFGRRLLFANAEYHLPVFAHKYGLVSLAGFADLARAYDRRVSVDPSPLHVDIGAGIRVRMTGDGAMLRVDLGYGLRDKRRTLSAGYVAPWGR